MAATDSEFFSQVHFTGESGCPKFQPNPYRKNMCTACFKEISKHNKSAVQSKDDLIRALEYTQSNEKVGTLIVSVEESPVKRGCVYLGGYRASINREFLEEAKVSHILNMAAGLVEFFGPKYQNSLTAVVDDLNVRYLTLPWQDSSNFEIPLGGLLEGMGFIEEGRKVGNVLVHCAQGKSRSSTIVVAYVMAASNVSFEEALKFVQEKRKMAEPNPGFLKFLSALDKEEEFAKFQSTVCTNS